ncbi:MAG: CoA transferase [Candidatus Methanolliviera sp. GoM_asphalt]|nr:MAG: CoA transferase [Candidatus Methanolliviera sp. GoM_asphalt]
MTMLKGKKVLDLTRLLPGPYCTWILSKLGADVLKIEDPGYEDYSRSTPLYDLINAGKKSMTLNLKNSFGREIFLDLVSRADILIESFRPGVMKRLGVGYETLKEHNEKIIFCSISGYGQNGPYKDVPGHDINYMSISGLFGINRTEDSPVIPGMQIADIGGGMFGALSILASLYRREINGRGEYIDVSMTDVVNCIFNVAYQGFIGGEESILKGGKTILTGLLPFYNIYETKDGKFISLGAIEPKFWNNFCLKIKREDLIQKQYDISVVEELKKIFLKKMREEWIEIFKGTDALITPVYSPEEVFNDPQIEYRGVFDREKKILNLPVKFLETTTNKGEKAPEMGESTHEILAELGYEEKDIEDLRKRGAV